MLDRRMVHPYGNAAKSPTLLSIVTNALSYFFLIQGHDVFPTEWISNSRFGQSYKHPFPLSFFLRFSTSCSVLKNSCLFFLSPSASWQVFTSYSEQAQCQSHAAV